MYLSTYMADSFVLGPWKDTHVTNSTRDPFFFLKKKKSATFEEFRIRRVSGSWLCLYSTPGTLLLSPPTLVEPNADFCQVPTSDFVRWRHQIL